MDETKRYRACRDEVEPLLQQWDEARKSPAQRDALSHRIQGAYIRHGFTAGTYHQAQLRRRTPKA